MNMTKHLFLKYVIDVLTRTKKKGKERSYMWNINVLGPYDLILRSIRVDVCEIT